MNILEALEVALPDLPATTAQRRYPKLDPRVIAKEHIEQGVRVVLAKMPGSEVYLRLTPELWQLLQLFDGERSYKQFCLPCASGRVTWPCCWIIFCACIALPTVCPSSGGAGYHRQRLTEGQAFCQRELRRASGKPDRGGAVWP